MPKNFYFFEALRTLTHYVDTNNNLFYRQYLFDRPVSSIFSKIGLISGWAQNFPKTQPAELQPEPGLPADFQPEPEARARKSGSARSGSGPPGSMPTHGLNSHPMTHIPLTPTVQFQILIWDQQLFKLKTFKKFFHQ